MVRKGLDTKKKELFLKLENKKFPPKNVSTQLKGEGGGFKALVAGPLKNIFLRLPLGTLLRSNAIA